MKNKGKGLKNAPRPPAVGRRKLFRRGKKINLKKGVGVNDQNAQYIPLTANYYHVIRSIRFL